jgi:hypothetical protein
VAVGTKQIAFASLCNDGLPRFVAKLIAKGESLRRWITMVEVKHARVLAIVRERTVYAGATEHGQQFRLQPPEAICLRSCPCWSVAMIPFSLELFGSSYLRTVLCPET